MKKFIGILIVLVTVMLNVSCEYITDLELEAGLTDGLVAHYSLEQASDSFTISGRGTWDFYNEDYFNGDTIGFRQPTAPAMLSVPGIYGNAINFTGLNCGGLTPHYSLESSGFSICLWINSSNTVLKYIFSSDQFFLQQGGPSTTLLFNVLGSTATYNSFINNQWQYLVCTYNNKTATIYLDGAKVAEVNISGSINTYTQLNFGISTFATDNWIGLLDEIRIYNRALSEAEIKKLMTVGVK